MAKKQNDIFCIVIKYIKVLDGYVATIGCSVHTKEHKIIGLKSHDCHILMHQICPLALCKTLSKKMSSNVIEFCDFFRQLFSKALQEKQSKELQKKLFWHFCI